MITTSTIKIDPDHYELISYGSLLILRAMSVKLELTAPDTASVRSVDRIHFKPSGSYQNYLIGYFDGKTDMKYGIGPSLIKGTHALVLHHPA